MTYAGNARAVLFVLTALVVAVFYPPLAHGDFVRWTGGTFGLIPGPTGGLLVSDVTPGTPAWIAGLRAGDRIVLPPFSIEYAALEVPHAGESATVTFRRSDGTLHQAHMVAQPATPLSPAEWALNIATALVVTVFLIIATVLVYMRPGIMTWSFYAFAVGYFSTAGPIAFYHGVLPPALYLAMVFVLGTLLGNVVVMPLLPFVLRFPNQPLEGWRAKANTAIWIALALGYALYIYEWVYLHGTGNDLSWASVLDEWLPLAVFVAAAIIVLKNYKGADAAVRARTGFLIAGTLMSFLAYAVYFIPSVDNTTKTAVSDLVILMPVCVAYAVLRHRVLDINFVLNRAIVYAALSIFIVMAVTLLDWTSSRIVSKAHLATLLEIGVTVGIGFGLSRLNRTFEHWVDVLLFRRRHEAERYLARVADALPYATSEDAITDGLVHEPVDALELIAGALYRRSSDGRRFEGVATSNETLVAPMGFDRNHNLVRFLQAGEECVWLDDVRAHLDASNSAIYVLAVPVLVRHELVSFVLYGAHRNGSQIDPDEVALLKALVREAARAYDHVEAVRTRELIGQLSAAPAGSG